MLFFVAEWSVDENIDKLTGEAGAYNPAAQAEYVRIVVGAGILRAEII